MTYSGSSDFTVRQGGGAAVRAGSGEAPVRTACNAPRHGTPSAYSQAGCRCDTARTAKRNYEKRLRAGIQPPAFVDATGTRRRLQALARIGYSITSLMPEIGWNGRPSGVLYGERVHRTTASRVAALYDRLSMTPGPSNRTRLRAAAKGWPPPLAWDDDIDNPHAQPYVAEDPLLIDDVKVDRVIGGERLELTQEERREVARRLLDKGRTVNDVAVVLRMNGTYARRLIEAVAS